MKSSVRLPIFHEHHRCNVLVEILRALSIVVTTSTPRSIGHRDELRPKLREVKRWLLFLSRLDALNRLIESCSLDIDEEVGECTRKREVTRGALVVHTLQTLGVQLDQSVHLTHDF